MTVYRLAGWIAAVTLGVLVFAVAILSHLNRDPLDVAFTYSNDSYSVAKVTNRTSQPVYDVWLEPYAMYLSRSDNTLDTMPGRRRVRVSSGPADKNDGRVLQPGESISVGIGTSYYSLGYNCLWAHFKRSPSGKDEEFAPNYRIELPPYAGD